MRGSAVAFSLRCATHEIPVAGSVLGLPACARSDCSLVVVGFQKTAFCVIVDAHWIHS